MSEREMADETTGDDRLREVEEILLEDVRGAVNALHVGDTAERKLRAERLNELLAAALKTVELRKLLAERAKD